MPLAPGTWGSILGILIYVIVRKALLTILAVPIFANLTLFHFNYALAAFELLVVMVLVFVGIWAASRTEKILQRKDPRQVVIDEVAGQFIAFIPIPVVLGQTWWPPILAFALFRLFDIVKPYPASKLESLPGGLGIMADDIVAGAYAAMGLMLTLTVSWLVGTE